MGGDSVEEYSDHKTEHDRGMQSKQSQHDWLPLVRQTHDRDRSPSTHEVVPEQVYDSRGQERNPVDNRLNNHFSISI